MKEETKDKFAEILAAAQAKTSIYQTDKKGELTELSKIGGFNPDTKKFECLPPEISKMQSFTILWQEGSGNHDGKVLKTWKEANAVMTSIYKEHSGIGYLKVKINVKWENGKEITDRADCSDNAGDFNPNTNTIGQYLKKQKSSMYAGNLNQGDRLSLSFEDNSFEVKETPETPELSALTFDQLFKEEIKPEVKPTVKIIDYSEKAIAVIGDTKPIKDKLKELGGRFNFRLTCGAGWIFPKTKAYTVRKALNLI